MQLAKCQASCPPPRTPFLQWANTGAGKDSNNLSMLFNGIRQSSWKIATVGLSRDRINQILDEIFQESNFKNWDGYDADPVSNDTLVVARRFLDSLPMDIPIPEIDADPDGDISFEWYKDNDNSLLVSVGCNMILSYACRHNGIARTGHSPVLFEMPITIAACLQDLFPVNL